MSKAPICYLKSTLPIVLFVLFMSYFFIDRPLSTWVFQFGMHQQKGFSGNLDLIITNLVYCSLLPIFVIYFYCRMHAIHNRLVDCLGLLAGSVSVAFFVKTSLQFLFGRFAPRYFNGNFLVFVQNPNHYGFDWLHGGGFPSGHMCVFTAALTSICLYYPLYRILAGILLGMLAVALIVANYHFLSDVIFGAYLGLSIALGMHYLQSQ